MNNTAAKEVIKIFMHRDGMSFEDAHEFLMEALFTTKEAIYNADDADEVWMDETGLEPDYLYKLLF